MPIHHQAESPGREAYDSTVPQERFQKGIPAVKIGVTEGGGGVVGGGGGRNLVRSQGLFLGGSDVWA